MRQVAHACLSSFANFELFLSFPPVTSSFGTHTRSNFAPGMKSSLLVSAETLGGEGGLAGKYNQDSTHNTATRQPSDERKKHQ